MKVNSHQLRGWTIPIVVAAGTVAVLEGADLLRHGLGVVVALLVAGAGIVALIVADRRKR